MLPCVSACQDALDFERGRVYDALLYLRPSLAHETSGLNMTSVLSADLL